MQARMTQRHQENATSPSRRFLLMMTAAFVISNGVSAFAPAQLPYHHGFGTRSCAGTVLFSSNDALFSDEDTALLQQRLDKMRLEIMEQEMSRIPNVDLQPHEVALQLLEGLRKPDDPVPDAGFRRLLRASTPSWRKLCYQSVGAPYGTPLELVASALGEAISRPNNQFDILTRGGYVVKFPRLQPHYDEEQGTCWLECQLLSNNKELLVTIGLQLWERQDGAWLLQKVDWQDFRQEYRPGIGREDWMRDTMRRLGCL